MLRCMAARVSLYEALGRLMEESGPFPGLGLPRVLPSLASDLASAFDPLPPKPQEVPEKDPKVKSSETFPKRAWGKSRL